MKKEPSLIMQGRNDEALHLLPLPRHRPLHGGARGSRHLGLCHDAGSRHLGAAGRDLPQPRAWRSHGHLHLCPVGRLLHAHLLVPPDECRLGQQRFVLDLRRHLRNRLCLLPAPLSRDQGCIARGAGAEISGPQLTVSLSPFSLFPS